MALFQIPSWNWVGSQNSESYFIYKFIKVSIFIHHSLISVTSSWEEWKIQEIADLDKLLKKLCHEGMEEVILIGPYKYLVPLER